MCRPQVLDRVASASTDRQHVVYAQPVSQRLRSRIDRTMAQSAGPAVRVGDQLPQPLPVMSLPACPAHAPEHTTPSRHPANRYPPSWYPVVGQGPGSEKPPSRTTQPGPGIVTTRVGDSVSPPWRAAGPPPHGRPRPLGIAVWLFEFKGFFKGDGVPFMGTPSPLGEVKRSALSSAWEIGG